MHSALSCTQLLQGPPFSTTLHFTFRLRQTSHALADRQKVVPFLFLRMNEELALDTGWQGTPFFAKHLTFRLRQDPHAFLLLRMPAEPVLDMG